MFREEPREIEAWIISRDMMTKGIKKQRVTKKERKINMTLNNMKFIRITMLNRDNWISDYLIPT